MAGLGREIQGTARRGPDGSSKAGSARQARAGQGSAWKGSILGESTGVHKLPTAVASKNGTTKARVEAPISIKPLNLETIEVQIEGTAPLVIARFSAKAAQKMKAKHEAGSTAASKRGARDPRDFDDDYESAKHVSPEGWCGIHAAAFRNGAIDACRAGGFKMTMAKMALFIEPDGFDVVDGAPLVRITGGEPECWIATTRNETGVTDLRARPMWRTWGATVRIRFDADMFTTTDVVNLMNRVGAQVGVGEGRPFSKKSNGLGFGTFRLL